jgi:hypothetical protein
MEKPKCLILDFDGTIADYTHRQYLRDIDFQAYIDESPNDIPSLPVCSIINRFKEDYLIIILSARGEKCRQETIDWLDKYYIHYDTMILKDDNDERDDYLVKMDLMREKILTKYDVFFAIDDRNSVANIYRENNIFTFQCGLGY